MALLSAGGEWARDVRSPLVLIAQSREHLHEAEGRVADLVLNDPGFVVQATVSQVAQAADTSDATVVRFCRSVGFRGFPELRMALTRDMTRAEEVGSARGHVDPLLPTDQAIVTYFSAQRVALGNTMEIQQASVLEEAVAAIAGATVLLILGDRQRSALAKEAERRFSSIGIPSHAVSELESLTGVLTRLRPGAVLLVLPGPVAPAPFLRVTQLAKEREVSSIVVSPSVTDEIASLADVFIAIHSGNVTVGTITIESLVSELALMEALVVGTAQQDHARTSTAMSLLQDPALQP